MRMAYSCLRLVGWMLQALADSSILSRMTVVKFDGERREPSGNNLAVIRAALKAPDVDFIEQNGGMAGVRLAKAVMD